jgi:subfamily B ATP-binding cassette protein MsbA
MIAAVSAMAIYAAGDAGQALLVRPIVDKTLPLGSDLTLVAWGIVGVYLLKGVGSYVSSYLMAGVGQRVVMDIRNALYRHILGQSAAFFAQRSHGQLMSRIGHDVSQVQQAVSETMADLARESLTALVLAAYLFYIDPRLTLFVLIVAPLII